MKKWIRLLSNKWLGIRGTTIYCPKCKSVNVSFGETTVTEQGEHALIECIVVRIETYPVRCADCNAEGIITECWK